MPRLIASHAAELRLETARSWLSERRRDEPVWIAAPTREAASRLLRTVVREGATFGWEAVSWGALIARRSLLPLGRKKLSAASSLALDAVCARVVHRLGIADRLGRFTPIADQPGLPSALARTLHDVRLGELPAGALAEVGHDELEAIRRGFEEELALAQLADRADVLRAAMTGEARATVILDPVITSPLEAKLAATIAGDDGLITLPAGDERAWRLLSEVCAPRETVEEPLVHSLSRARMRLFEPIETTDPPDSTVTIVSAPGPSRECVEIARRCMRAARDGLRFDQIAVVLHTPGPYRPHLVEAFRRASIPLRFTRGTHAPDPSGRALLALLSCKHEGLSARAFGEYLSLGVVPELEEGAPPEAQDLWVVPDEEQMPIGLQLPEPVHDEAPADLGSNAIAGTLRVPRDWETLIVDAAVIGGRDRWERRLDVLHSRLEREHRTLDPDDPRRAGLIRRRAQLVSLRLFAMPILDALSELPEHARWGEWLTRLEAIATRAIRHPETVLRVLRELAPLGPVGPVDLPEVKRVLEPRLTQLLQRPTERVDGVFVATTPEIRGTRFEMVFVPGLAERLFPKRVLEDPLLLDASRLQLPVELQTRADAMDAERLSLRLALGAAKQRVVLSWPDVDLERSRPRVPSFYALEVARAARGELPSFDALKSEAVEASPTHTGWPAPNDPLAAIDAAEFDLATLRNAFRDKQKGGMAYLLDANAHAKRALGFRARRWLSGKWTSADGLVLAPKDPRAHLLERHQPGARPFSATALQSFATCPYRFALYTLFRLETREVPEAIEQLNPLQRGSLIHDIQFETLTRARDDKMLPLDTPEAVARVRTLLDHVIDELAQEYAEELVPAIPRVWEESVADMRHDLHEWLSVLAAQDWEPDAFELAFGLTRGTRRDARSSPEPVQLHADMLLRGAIDLVERKGDVLRATDSKTGRVPRYVKAETQIGGGRVLQPLLYALALEQLYPDTTVEGGRLFYCTSRGDFAVRDVALDRSGRDQVHAYLELVAAHLQRGFFPAAPIEDGCRWCDYKPVCGPHEERRALLKHRRAPGPLQRLVQIRRQR